MSKNVKIFGGLILCSIFAVLVSQLIFPVWSALGFCLSGAFTLKTLIEKYV